MGFHVFRRTQFERRFSAKVFGVSANFGILYVQITNHKSQPHWLSHNKSLIFNHFKWIQVYYLIKSFKSKNNIWFLWHLWYTQYCPNLKLVLTYIVCPLNIEPLGCWRKEEEKILFTTLYSNIGLSLRYRVED